jgi:uncharacterized protein
MRSFLLILSLLPVLGFAELPRLARLGAVFTIADGGKLVLQQVQAGGNADRAGLRNGDLVVSIAGEPAKPVGVFVRPFLRRAGGSKAVFEVERGGERKKIEVDYRTPPPERGIGDFEVVYSSVTVAKPESERRTLITVPNDKKKHSALLFLAGSGCASQESPDAADPVTQMLYELTRRGFVTMRVEKTSMGDSTGPPCYSDAGDVDQEVAGYRAGYAALAAHPSVNPKRIYILGHSAGARLAPLVAKDLQVAGIIAAGAMGTDFMRYVLAMRERERRLEGRPDAEVEQMMAITRGCLHQLLVEGKSPDEIEKANPKCKKQVRFDSPPAYIAQWTKYDLSESWAPVKAPVIVMYGTGDFVTSEEESAALVSRINAGGKADQAKLVVLPMDHGFMAHETPERAWRAEQGIIPPAGLYKRVVDSIESFATETQRR